MLNGRGIMRVALALSGVVFGLTMAANAAGQADKPGAGGKPAAKAAPKMAVMVFLLEKDLQGKTDLGIETYAGRKEMAADLKQRDAALQTDYNERLLDYNKSVKKAAAGAPPVPAAVQPVEKAGDDAVVVKNDESGGTKVRSALLNLGGQRGNPAPDNGNPGQPATKPLKPELRLSKSFDLPDDEAVALRKELVAITSPDELKKKTGKYAPIYNEYRLMLEQKLKATAPAPAAK